MVDQLTVHIPHAWKEAVKLWDDGEPLRVFQVESEGATQENLWGAAMDCLAKGEAKILGAASLDEGRSFTTREIDVVNSIVHGAKSHGWAKMIWMHLDPRSPAITIQKEK